MGFSGAIVELLPQLRIVQSSFRKSFLESPVSDAYMSELFPKESENLNVLLQNTQVKPKEVYKHPRSMFGSSELMDDVCADTFANHSAIVKKNIQLQGGDMFRNIAVNIATPKECCKACMQVYIN